MKLNEIANMIQDCVDHENILTKEERDFITDLIFRTKKNLTTDQENNLRAIWERVT